MLHSTQEMSDLVTALEQNYLLAVLELRRVSVCPPFPQHFLLQNPHANLQHPCTHWHAPIPAKLALCPSPTHTDLQRPCSHLSHSEAQLLTSEVGHTINACLMMGTPPSAADPCHPATLTPHSPPPPHLVKPRCSGPNVLLPLPPPCTPVAPVHQPTSHPPTLCLSHTHRPAAPL